MRSLLAVLGAGLLISAGPMSGVLAANLHGFDPAEPVLAGGGQITAGDCDLKLSIDDGPLVDDTIEVRIYQDYTIHGFGYPPNTTIWMNGLWRGDTLPDNPWFVATTDALGAFVTTHHIPGDDPFPGWETMTLVARDPAPGGCSDSVDVWTLPATPFVDTWNTDPRNLVTQFRMDVIWLYQSGITAGCTPTLFCPRDPITREQMASFLARALKLPSTSHDYFTDDATSIHHGAINRLAAAGITGGCTATSYCPKDLVTREQMASFLARALELPGTSVDFFTDDATSIHQGDINRLASSGITGGCGPTQYCPAKSVTREQMAAFLHRALD